MRSAAAARIGAQAAEVARAVAAAKDATLERDEARRSWEKARSENAELVARLGTGASKPATATPAAKVRGCDSQRQRESERKKPRPEQAYPQVPPVEPSAEETTLLAQRAELVAELARLTAESKKWGGHHNGFAARAQIAAVEKRLSEEVKPRLHALRQLRHFAFVARQAKAMRAEAEAALATS